MISYQCHITLWELMKRLHVEVLIYHLALIQSIAQFEPTTTIRRVTDRRPKDTHTTEISQTLKRLQVALEELETPVSIYLIGEMLSLLREPDTPASTEALRDLANKLRDQLQKELSKSVFYAIEPSKAHLLGSNLFGETVAQSFPLASFDITEAGQCLAMGRGTACVFHLMRVMELGLKALGASLNDPALTATTNRSWDAILKKCDAELTVPLSKRTAEWASDDNFFSGATARLRAVKDAWRNPTMHVAHKYTEEEAWDIWNHVASFMPHLATKLKGEKPSA